MTRWNAHQKLARSLRLMAHFEQRVRATRQRRTKAEKTANSRARHALARAFFDVQDCWRNV
ncbi:MAG: hypothetical protein KJ787_11015 [Gammaproteobacteria bacterium]|nr:hypothetical protein [Gammaproteobacteria bacterium]MBU1646850.1 hypothetical protein [Gammaproteobacteria bacterium]MBU1971685.1 hypothetical protein [Gammaproteobacteria bacterium]